MTPADIELALTDATFAASKKFQLTVSTTFGVGITAITGPNGSGKSTMLRGLATASLPVSGKVALSGVPYERATLPTIRSQIGYAPQEFSLSGGERVVDFLTYSCWLKKLPRDEWPANVDRVLAAVGLEGRRRNRFRSLSGGMKRRLGIAQAILGKPQLLILDEPTAGLDSKSRDELVALTNRLGSSRIVLFATHLHEGRLEGWREFALAS